MQTKRKIRRKYLIDKRFQLGAAGTLVAIQLLMFLAAFLAASWLYLFVLDRRMVCSHNAAFLSHLGVAGAIATALVIFWCIRRTHAIAGPIYKTRQLLRAAAAGNIPQTPVRFRKKDHFQGLADDLNTCLEAISRLQTERQEALAVLGQLRDGLQTNKHPDSEGRKQLQTTISQMTGGIAG